ncbi:MAG: alpha/beta hydrolase [Anaerolineales bacterium]|jgi:proline iminopeptidase
MSVMTIRDVSLYVHVVGGGYPLVIMHGGPGVDHSTMRSLDPLSRQFKLIYYDHRCNGRSHGAEFDTMTWENLTADADALRQALGIERWAVLGHSFGGMVALEYALRYPKNLTHLVLMDTCGDTWWVQQNAPRVLAKRGYSAATVRTAERFFNGKITPEEFSSSVRKLSLTYYHKINLLQIVRDISVGMRMKTRPEATIFGYKRLLKNWTVMERLHDIVAPTLVIGGRSDFQFPPEHQAALAAGIPNARLEIIERAGHNPHTERKDDVLQALCSFLKKVRS